MLLTDHLKYICLNIQNTPKSLHWAHLLFTFHYFISFWPLKKYYLLYKTPNLSLGHWVTKSGGADTYLSSMGHLVLHKENYFPKSQSSVSKLSRMGQKEGMLCPWLQCQARAYDLLQTYCVLLRSIGYIYSNIYLAFTVCKAMSEVQQEGYYIRIISDLQAGQQRNYLPGETTEVCKLSSNKFVFMFF